MITIEYNNEKYEIKSDVNEFTIGEYEIINNYLREDSEYHFDKWFNIIEYLGIPRNVIEDIDGNELIDIINVINLSEVDRTFINDINLNGDIYKCDLNTKGEPRITGKHIKMLEKVCKNDVYIADIMAILFKKDGYEGDHYDLKHISEKSKLLKNEPANICVPYIIFIAERYVKNILNVNNNSIK